jgi:4-alpha-glucanotransferase
METYSNLIKKKVRLSGVLLHPTSLPSGVLDDDVYNWLDFMAEAGLCVWQVLPLGVPQENLSPYQCYSAFAMNPALLAESAYQFPDYDNPDYNNWLIKEDYWIHDYALFMSLKQSLNNTPWFEWPNKYRLHDKDTLQIYKKNNIQQISAVYWQQYCLYRRWGEIQTYAHDHNIMIFGDMPIFIAHDSADIWMNPESFLLDENSQPTVVAGVPPDYFSETGQRWGNPHYNWERMRQNEFKWWLQRLRNHFSLFDIVRIDHFRGLEAVWVIPSESETAVDGEWQKVPGEELLEHLKQEMGELAIVAEDLGIITPEVNELRLKYHLPGMSVLQFSFDGFSDNPHKPENITYDRIVYTGTHDNDTTLGWFKAQTPERQSYIMNVLNISDANLVTDSIIDAALNSSGQLVIVPLQDLLHLGSEARMNIPGVSENNWTWKFQWDQIPLNLASETRQRLQDAGRLYQPEIS